MRLSQLLAKERTLPIEMGDDRLTIIYNPSEYTAEVEDRWAANAETRRGIAATVESLVAILIGWDLVDDDGESVKIDRETLRTLPGKFLSDVMEAINEDANPKKVKGRTSRGG